MTRAVIRRPARPAEVDLYLVVVRPHVQQTPREFAAVIGEKEPWRTALCHQAVRHRHNVLRAQPLADFDGERFTAEDVNNGQCSQTAAVGQVVRHEVQTPDLVRTNGHASFATRHHHLASFGQLRTELQLFFGVQPIDPVAAHTPAFTFEQHVHAPVAVSHTVCAISRIRWRNAVCGSLTLR